MGPGSPCDAEERSIPWRTIFQRLSLAYHWTPAEILELTPPQLALYLTDEPEPGGTVAMSVDEGSRFIANRRAAREAWIDEVALAATTTAAQHTVIVGERRAPSVNATSEASSPSRAVPPSVSRAARHDVRPTEAARRAASSSDIIATLPRYPSAAREEPRMPSLARKESFAPLAPSLGVVRDAGRLDALAQRVEAIARTALDTQGAISRLERRRADGAHFS
ncbi:MAG: hypothetical protein KF708_22395 [Pirellulales bacterium]|nr:hypothetical protein [Pirellulales bacterium]